MNKILKGLSLCFITIVLFFSSSMFAFADNSPLNIKIVNIDNSTFPSLRTFISISDAQGFPIMGLSNADFTISEDNLPIKNFNISSYKNVEQPLSIVLTFDTSGSMGGTPLQNSVEAAKNFISTLIFV